MSSDTFQIALLSCSDSSRVLMNSHCVPVRFAGSMWVWLSSMTFEESANES